MAIPASKKSDSDFHWPGEPGFSGFPKHLPEDTIEYIIHILDTSLTSAQIRSQLLAVSKAAGELTRRHLSRYIWQREPFALNLELDDGEKEGEKRWVLRGRTDFGDSVADEWVIVYLLRELSKQFASCWVRVFDSDGEFLLIEAAIELPPWLTPEVAENRVWIHDGKLLVIPRDAKTTERDGKGGQKVGIRSLSRSEALSAIAADANALTYSLLIEKEAFYRVRDFPLAIDDNLHHALITLPRNLAWILKRNPESVASAVEAFYLRDPISLKPLKTKCTYHLRFPPTDLVTVSVRFSKVMYAQLRGQYFKAPFFWTAELNKARLDGDVTFARLETGMKLTCGFEMMLKDRANKDKTSVREIKLLLQDVKNGEETLPTDAEVEGWEMRQDDEGWMDIDYDKFGNIGAAAKADGVDMGAFGDEALVERFKKMVSNLERWCHVSESEDSELDGTDDDDDDERSKDRGYKPGVFEDDDFDEEAMREMLGLPPKPKPAASAPNVSKSQVQDFGDSDESEVDDDDDEESDSSGFPPKSAESAPNISNRQVRDFADPDSSKVDSDSDSARDSSADKSASFDNASFEHAMRTMMGLPHPNPPAESASKTSTKSPAQEPEDPDSSEINDAEFQKAMRDIMALPPEQRADAAPDVLRRAVREIKEYDASDEEGAEEAEAIRKMAEEMETELKKLGALDAGSGGGEARRKSKG